MRMRLSAAVTILLLAVVPVLHTGNRLTLPYLDLVLLVSIDLVLLRVPVQLYYGRTSTVP